MFLARPVILFAALSGATAGSNPPAEFSQERAMAHIRALAGLKSRTAGTSGEAKAVRYVSNQLRGLGLDVRTETFPFTSYDLQRAQLRVGGVSIAPKRIIFDPYSGASAIEGDVAYVTAAMVNGGTALSLARRIVVTTDDVPHYRLVGAGPSAIVYVSEKDFEMLKVSPEKRAVLLPKGSVRTMTSANLVAATQTGSTEHEVILSAHIDSAGTPGAQDNASGVAVLLELARSLSRQKLPFRMRFVFFGAEELGLLGSAAYLYHHRDDLQRCELLFNLDSVGGKDIWIDMRGGVRNLPKVKLSGKPLREAVPRANADFKRWTWLNPPNTPGDASNVPSWLQTAILDSVRELGYPINQGHNAGSDHRTFSEAGIVATDIAIGGIKSHTPDDLPEQINPESLERAARIVSAVVLRSMAVTQTGHK
jgi:aminopeptidase YwaD